VEVAIQRTLRRETERRKTKQVIMTLLSSESLIDGEHAVVPRIAECDDFRASYMGSDIRLFDFELCHRLQEIDQRGARVWITASTESN
jgi:hypothetical protein